MFNDMWPGEYRGIPNQKLAASDPTIQYPNLEAYTQYTSNGYSQM